MKTCFSFFVAALFSFVILADVQASYVNHGVKIQTTENASQPDAAAAYQEGLASKLFFSQLGTGIKIKETPLQQAVEEYYWIDKKNYQLGVSDVFSIKGLVISKKQYTADERADIAPFDYVIGWDSMSDPAVLAKIDIWQGNRFYYWHVREFPIPRKEIELNSTNLHLIPESALIAQQLDQINRGQTVMLKGFLVDVKDGDGFIWPTSRVRNDSGDGACEIMLVTEISLLQSY